MSRWWSAAKPPEDDGKNEPHTFGVRKVLGDTKPVVSLRFTTG